MPYTEEGLLSGKVVLIARTDDELPPTHGEAYDNEWKGGSSRKGLKFYESTVDYMRNEWTEQPDNTRSAEVEHKGQTLLLFFDERTHTWNSAEALDVDHKTPWETHFADLEVWSKADAMLAYNDVSNLRTIPATYNRARAGADRILDEHGVDSPEWKSWVDTKMRFDASKDYPEYDPDLHSANRTRQTTEAPWTAGVKREGLAFDDGIKTIWLDRALKEAYAGEVKVPDPDHPDDRSRDHAVQLFQCAATGQYVTRGGIDIDHEIPFGIALDFMLKQNEAERLQAAINSDEPVPVISKADVLDLYNNPENLRLMSRSANSAHEWEVGLDGQLYDPDLDDVEYATPEPTVTVVDDDAPIEYEDDAPRHARIPGTFVLGDDAPVFAQHDAVPIVLNDDDPFAALAPDGDRKRARPDDMPQDGTARQDDDVREPELKRAKNDEGDPAFLSRHDAAILAMHPDDLALFDKVAGKVETLDPAIVGPVTEKQRDNIALALVAAARSASIADIDHVVSSPDGKLVFGVSGPLDADTGKVWFPVNIMKNQPFEVTAELLAGQRQERAQDQTQDQAQTPQRSVSHQMS